ncbi:tape measure protein [Pseudomonas phage PARCL1pr]|nr:tape measure protein [Pseudomonas phage PARCL1pr]
MGDQALLRLLYPSGQQAGGRDVRGDFTRRNLSIVTPTRCPRTVLALRSGQLKRAVHSRSRLAVNTEIDVEANSTLRSHGCERVPATLHRDRYKAVGRR